MRVSVCFSFQNSHTQSMTEILKKGLSRNFQKLVKHTTSLTFPPSKKQHFVGKIFLSNLIFSVAFLSIIFIPAKCRRGKTIWNMRHTSSQLQDLCSASPLLQMFDVRNHVRCPTSQFPNCNVGITLHVISEVVGR